MTTLETPYIIHGEHWLYSGNPKMYFASHVFSIKINGKTQNLRRYLYEREIGKIPEGKVLVRVCRSSKCVNPYHARVCTQTEINRWLGKLTEEDVEQIKALKTTGWKQQQIADMFNLHYSTVSLIVRGKRWAAC
jgi:hypothetical protein